MEEWKNKLYSFKDTVMSWHMFEQFLPTSAMSYDCLLYTSDAADD